MEIGEKAMYIGVTMFAILAFMDLVTSSVHTYVFVATGTICLFVLATGWFILKGIKHPEDI